MTGCAHLELRPSLGSRASGLASSIALRARTHTYVRRVSALRCDLRPASSYSPKTHSILPSSQRKPSRIGAKQLPVVIPSTPHPPNASSPTIHCHLPIQFTITLRISLQHPAQTTCTVSTHPYGRVAVTCVGEAPAVTSDLCGRDPLVAVLCMGARQCCVWGRGSDYPPELRSELGHLRLQLSDFGHLPLQNHQKHTVR